MMTGLRRRRPADGYSAIEILAVAIIIGLLASIAIPLYLDQQKKGHDAAAKASLNTVAVAIVGYIETNKELPIVTVAGSSVSFGDGTVATLEPGVILGALTGTTDTWCIDATQPHGDRAKVKGYKYSSSKEKVDEGKCP